MAEALKPSDESIQLCSKAIKDGGLVIFPTETVYGVGANAFDEIACLNIYKAKGRPANDPLICHVTSKDMALTMFKLNDGERELFNILTKSFWPGPLTIVAPAKDTVPLVVRANGPTVGVRYPINPIAQKLINFAGVPIAAPSANRFSHVSPSCCEHALNDLGHFPGIMAIDGGKCTVGIESTVCGITGGNPVVFRRGHITQEDIQKILDENGIKKTVTALSVSISAPIPNTNAIDSGKKGELIHPESLVAPGQLTKHYAPKSPTILINDTPVPLAKSRRDITMEELSKSAIIDFGGALIKYRDMCRVYLELTSSKDSEEAERNLFSLLRDAESCSLILVKCVPIKSEYMALLDRMIRSASGIWGHIID